jgi:hypothetical protein
MKAKSVNPIRTPKREPDDRAQSKRFIEAAREAGADESKEGADRAFKKAVVGRKVKPIRRP